MIAYTDENGRYTLNLGPGVWDVDVEMLGFTTAHGQITVPSNPVRQDGIQHGLEPNAPVTSASLLRDMDS